MTARPDAVDAIGRHGIVAVVRHDDPRTAQRISRAVLAGGIAIVEITYTVPDAASLIAALSGQDALIGAGTVLTARQVDEAVGAGARFVMSPCLSIPVIEAARRHGIEAIPGVLTPTEIAAAVEAGARTVKVFPAGSLGAGHLSALQQVFPRVRLVPTGGVDEDNIARWRAAGAFGVGVGSELNRAMDAGGEGAVVELARRLTHLWAG